MRYETTIPMTLEGEGRKLDLATEFTLLGSKPNVSKTYFRRHSEFAEWSWEEGEWFWVLCPPRLYSQLDREMVEQWNEKASGRAQDERQCQEVPQHG